MSEYIKDFASQVVDLFVSEQIINFFESVKDQISDIVFDKIESNNIFKNVEVEKELGKKDDFYYNELTLEFLTFYYN